MRQGDLMSSHLLLCRGPCGHETTKCGLWWSSEEDDLEAGTPKNGVQEVRERVLVQTAGVVSRETGSDRRTTERRRNRDATGEVTPGRPTNWSGRRGRLGPGGKNGPCLPQGRRLSLRTYQLVRRK